MMKNRETRSVITQVRAEKGDGEVTLIGRPIVFDAVTDLGEFDEIIERGALDGTDLKDVPFFANHDLNMIPLARSRNNNENSTMRLIADDEGLEIKARIDVENNADSKKLASATERGDISGMSFMFTIAGESWEDLDTEHPLRRVTAIDKVFEVSAVTFPAYEQTSISLAQRNADILAEARANDEALQKAREEAEKKTALKEKIEKALNG